MPSIVGTWKLVQATARDAAGAARPSPYGGKALGRVTFTADGRMMSVVCDGRKELPAGVSANTAPIAATTPMTARSLSPGLTRPQTRAASAAIRCAGCALRAAPAWSSFPAAPDRRKRGTPRGHLGAHRGGIGLRTCSIGGDPEMVRPHPQSRRSNGKTFSRNRKDTPAVTNGDTSCRLEIWR
jgi:hypothetical protein